MLKSRSSFFQVWLYKFTIMVMEDSRPADLDGATTEQLCCLIDDGRPCMRPAGNASYGKKIQKTVQQRKLKLELNDKVFWMHDSVVGSNNM